MAGNTVEILIESKDDAAPDMDDLKARLDELSAKVAEARIDVDDADAAAKLDRMRAKLIDLGDKTAKPKITVSGAIRAEAEIHAVEASLDNMKRKEDEALAEAGPEGFLSRLFYGTSGTGGGENFEEGGLSSLLPGGALLAGLAVAVPLIYAAAAEVAGLVAGFAAAGTGAGAFALLAYPAFESVKGAIGDNKKELDKLPVSEQNVVRGIQQLTGEWHKMSNAFQPEVFKVFNGGLQLANKLLPDVTPFATTFANVLTKLLGQASKFAGSKGFQEWLKQFHSLEGPALTSIGDGIGKVVIAIGKLFTVMSGKDVAHTINILFDTIAGIILGFADAVKRLMNSWDETVSGFDKGRHVVASAAHDIASAFDTARHAVASFAHDVATYFDDARHDVADFAHNVASVFDEIRANIHRWADDVVNYVSGHWKQLVAAVTGALGLIIDALATHWKAVEHGFETAYNFVAGIVKTVLGKIESIIDPFASWVEGVFKTAWHAVEDVFTTAWNWLASKSGSGTSTIKGILNWFGKLGGLFGGWWDDAVRAVSSKIDTMIHFVESIPGRINSALSGLPGMMFKAGVHVIQSLLDGITSMIGKIGSVMGSIASKVAGFFGLSPAKEGPLSGGGAPEIRGQHFAADIAAGMLSGRGAIASAAHQLAGAAGIGPGAGSGTAGGAGQIAIQLTAGGGGSGLDNMFMTWLKTSIRASGGDPRILTKKVQFQGPG